MAPKYHCFQNYSRLYGVPGIPSEEEENALANAAPVRVCVMFMTMEYRKL